MLIQIVLVILLLALAGYVIFLHIQLAKKNIFIGSTVKRLSGIERSRSMDEMMVFLMELKKIDQYSSYFTDKFLDDNTLNFLFENEKDLKIFVHYTKEESDAVSITADGFKFTDSFYKTALPISKDKLDLIIKHNRRKYFGEYLIVICISNDIVNFYSMELEKAHIKDYDFENILTETLPEGSENSDLVYQLPPQFIKGFINHRTGVIVRNEQFDPYYNSPAFSKNIYLLRNK